MRACAWVLVGVVAALHVPSRAALAQAVVQPDVRADIESSLAVRAPLIAQCFDRAPRDERTGARTVHTVVVEVTREGRIGTVTPEPLVTFDALRRCLRPLLDGAQLRPPAAGSAITVRFTADELRRAVTRSLRARPLAAPPSRRTR